MLTFDRNTPITPWSAAPLRALLSGLQCFLRRGLSSAVCMGTTLLTYAINCHVTLKAAIVSAVVGSDENEINNGYGDGSLAGGFYFKQKKKNYINSPKHCSSTEATHHSTQAILALAC